MNVEELNFDGVGLNQPVLVMTHAMHYLGVLVRVKGGCLWLADARLVYETGPLTVLTDGKAVSGQGGFSSEPFSSNEDHPPLPIPVISVQCGPWPIAALPPR